MNEHMSAQVFPLPEDILKRKWAGDLEGAMAAIDARLARYLPDALRERLTLERALLERLPRNYPHTRCEALSAIRSHIPDFQEAELDAYEAQGAVDFLYIEGEKRYFYEVYPNLLQWDRSLMARAGEEAVTARPLLDQAIADIKLGGSLGYRIRLRVTLQVEDAAFEPGQTYRVHLPVPKPCAQQSNIQIFCDPDGLIAPEHSAQRTVFFERTLATNRPFAVEYEYDSRVHYVDFGGAPLRESSVYAGAEPPTPADLSELPPHLTFTPYLRELARQVRGDLTGTLQIARACYDFVTQKVTYAFVRDYLLLDNIAEYVAVNLKGDCGAQTLLFMALLRLNGIPARWQSGTNARADSLGSHDWAQFYIAPYGWLLCDCSFGGGAWRSGALERWHYYFGNLDPFRMVANSQYMAPLDPPKRFLRNDPYDNQSGECETAARALEPNEHKTDRELISLTRL